jgi:peptidoglycan/xylan/chitin deacetylase (PgdA/CDA1 family)
MRALKGYAGNPPIAIWPNDAKIAINFVINYEEGAENSPVNGDDLCETLGGEFPLVAKGNGVRHLSMESLYEYGARCGIWNLMNVFDSRQIPVTFFATGLALKLNPPICRYLSQSSHEIAGHGWRWIDYANESKAIEKKHILQTIDFITQEIGYDIKGWYTGRKSNNTRDLLIDCGNFIYDSDSYADDFPYYYNDSEHLIIPYNLDCNDFRFTTNPGFCSSEDFYLHLKNAFDYCYQHDKSQLLTIGLHPRISGRHSRLMALIRFIDYSMQHELVWYCKRIELATLWADIVG